MSIVKRIAHVLIIVLTLIVGATAAAVIVSQTAWFKNWLRGYIVREAQHVSERHAVDRAARRQSVLRRRDGEHRRLDGRQPGGGGQGSRPRLQRLRAAHQRAVGRQHPPRQAGDLPAARRRHLVAEPAGQETGDRGRSLAVRTSRSRSTPSASPTDRSSSSRRSARPASRCRSASIISTRSCRSSTSRCAIRSRSRTCRSADPSRRSRSTRCRAASRSRTTRVFVDKLALRTSETSLSFDGAVQHYLTKPVFNLQISSDKLSLPEIARLVPALAGIRLQPSFNVKADGPLDRLGVEMNVQSSAGVASGKMVADLLAPGQSVQGDLSVQASRSVAAAERPDAEERHHRGRARRPARRGAVERQRAARHASRSTRRGSSPPATSPSASTRTRSINGRQVGVDGRAVGVRRVGDRRRQRHAAGFRQEGARRRLRRARHGARTSICASCRAS